MSPGRERATLALLTRALASPLRQLEWARRRRILGPPTRHDRPAKDGGAPTRSNERPTASHSVYVSQPAAVPALIEQAASEVGSATG
jgi:hypothetical protein